MRFTGKKHISNLGRRLLSMLINWRINWKQGFDPQCQSWHSVGPEPIPDTNRTDQLRVSVGSVPPFLDSQSVRHFYSVGTQGHQKPTDFPISRSGIGSVLWNGFPDKYWSVLGLIISVGTDHVTCDVWHI